MKANESSWTGSGKSITLLFILLTASIAAVVAGFWQLNRATEVDREYLANAGELRVLSQQIATNAAEAVSGREEAFGVLQDIRNEFQGRYDTLNNGDVSIGLPPASAQPGAVGSRMVDLSESWGRVQINTDSILSNQQAILSLHEVAATLARMIPQLQLQYDEIVQIMLEKQVDARQVVIAQEQALRAERIINNVARLQEGSENASLAAEDFSRDVSHFGTVLGGMLKGNAELGIFQVIDPEVRSLLTEISELFEFVSGSAEDILNRSSELAIATAASDVIFQESRALLRNSSNLTNAFETLPVERDILQGNQYTVIAPGAVALLSILLIGWIMVRDTRRRYQETVKSNKKNETAILRLLTELSDLADGDLTVSATVTEDFTGAIADSINFSIEQLRTLVDTINQTAVSVAGAADETQNTARHLAEAAENQAREISDASTAINEMAVSIDQVSANAQESSSVAERSVGLAKKGNTGVQNTISGMNTIREQIQDTSKRIKRLGESSQEIGDIVSLINEIADQTNILALNAAIQASMAGSAGRGFAVVADEVQRLAERASAATRQIEGLVKTIQTDTNEAVISMEQTTTEVVRGASLAQDAGVSLEEIETVSHNLSDLIANISRAASQQASSAGHISSTMNVIQEITTQTSAGTNATAHSVGHLADMASDMRESVSGFKLPEKMV
ncbi:methyl-accepting chemotaxis protein [Sansalvadorimonas sp. 2012CJ34-2]|uniref:Methyl-accepting chemotaxis protein n=1 Tax=Parendozoicomonas callyspongiae TaxID=2942213 RepID=A0ABT0PCG6_9GAMM|nr:methyl-accepting chemotaxis protein [Sansalvadorimonas sp. 2012CJ34-2]MCL6268447.1 methyl-accepting chemotaxis protein [Sansalvadorimonas sp. 2012CJ34-2]